MYFSLPLWGRAGVGALRGGIVGAPPLPTSPQRGEEQDILSRREMMNKTFP